MSSSNRSRKIRLISVAVVFVASLAVYTLTLAPTVGLVDSGELIVAAKTLGVAHPPGFPLYVLLAHLATLVPVGSIAARVNFASAVFAALATATLTWLASAALEHASILTANSLKSEKKAGRRKKSKKASSVKVPGPDDGGEDSDAIVRVVPALVAGLLLAFSRTLWSYATVAEVYTLNALLILVTFALIFRWRRGALGTTTRGRGDAATRRESLPSPRPLNAAAFVFGLGLCVHHVTVALTLPALAMLVLATQGWRFFFSRRLIYAALSSLAGLMVYAYLPLAALRSPIMNWGDPRTFERLRWHVSGRQYQTFLEFEPRLVTEFARFATREFGPVWLPLALLLAIAGFIVLFHRDRVLLLFFSMVVVFNLGFGFHYGIAEDKDAYYLPTFVSLAVAAGFGSQWVLLRVSSLRLPQELTRAVAAAILLLVPAISLASNLGYNNHRRYFIARDYVENIFSTIEPNGMLLTGDWQVYSPMFYLRHIEGERRDVTAIDVTLLRRSWYFDYLKQEYPDLMERTREKVDAFVEDLTHWERDPETYNRDLALNERINSRFHAMILAFVSDHINAGPVYVTYDIGAMRPGPEPELTRSLTAGYQLLPQGLVFQLFSERVFHEPSEPALLTRGLADGTIKFEDDSTVRIKVFPVYVDMLTNRGRYLAAFNRHDQAIELFKQALTLDPNSRNAQQSIAESLGALRKLETRKPE